ncbi:GL22798 [Drosophila persimilis]|uniref:GL22798 n=1 Tax=Drosophila persimilis TaxID=7234 RepID=B4GZI5_DROPE|nr:GL22798 [Drosophila persimilis]
MPPGCPEETPASWQRRESPRSQEEAALKEDFALPLAASATTSARTPTRWWPTDVCTCAWTTSAPAGFRKVTSNESCNSPACSYALRHTHYHCVTCNCSVLSRAQLASHKHRPAGSGSGSGSGSALPKSEGASGPDPKTHP